MSTTNVPTEWLVRLEELIDKISTAYSESIEYNQNLGALVAHFKASKYFNQPEQSSELHINEEFIDWYYSTDDYSYDNINRSWTDLKADKKVPFSEVLKAFQNRGK